MTPVLLQLAWLFLGLSLLAVGGGTAVIPDMQRAVVDTYHWMSGPDFLDLYALTRVTPGPGSLLATLVGESAAGPAGAAVATLAMFTPPCLVVYGATRIWHRYHSASWRDRAERGLAPVAIGMIFASCLTLIRGSEHTVSAYALTLAATLVLSLTKVHPLVVVAAGAGLGWLLGF